jgi:hypothetical protein
MPVRKTLHKIEKIEEDFRKLTVKLKENTNILKQSKDTKGLFYFQQDVQKLVDKLVAECRRIHE